MTQTVELIPVDEDGLRVLERLTQDPASTGEFAWFGWSDPGRFRRRWAEDGLFREDGGFLLVVRGAERLGFVNWRRRPLTPGAFSWEIGIAMAPEARGQGHGTLAQRLLASYLFAHTTVHRIEAATEADNLAEQRALEKAGFTREGIRRAAGWRDGAWRDGVIYSILRTDPAAG
jgi:RimJ/RimL family protein N-acetyltransferase